MFEHEPSSVRSASIMRCNFSSSASGTGGLVSGRVKDKLGEAEVGTVRDRINNDSRKVERRDPNFSWAAFWGCSGKRVVRVSGVGYHFRITKLVNNAVNIRKG